MRYEYTPEQRRWRDEVRAFFRHAVTPALRREMRPLYERLGIVARPGQ